MARKVPLGVLVSGSGSNLQSLIDHCEANRLDAEIRIVVSNNPGVLALERCRRHGIAAVVVNHRDYASREAFDEAVVAVLRENGVELVVMAGFLRIITPVFFAAFPQRILNIHPALLPAFPGVHVQQKALDYGARFAGCTVHFADPGVDTGPIIIQAVVPVREDDTAETLSARILQEEHKIYPRAIQLYAEGRLEVSGRRVFVRNPAPPHGVLHNPPLSG